MDFSDFAEFGAGLAMGSIMSRTIGDALDARTGISALTYPQTRAEIQALLDKLDLRLANGEISEATYKTITAKWQQRLESAA